MRYTRRQGGKDKALGTMRAGAGRGSCEACRRRAARCLTGRACRADRTSFHMKGAATMRLPP